MIYILPILIGLGLYWVSNRCRGRNGRMACRLGAWGTWLLLLASPILMGPQHPLLYLINVLIRLTPSAICYLLAANYLLKEVRSQQRGDFTDAA